MIGLGPKGAGVVIAIALGGCANLLGLDPTELNQDAVVGIDAGPPDAVPDPICGPPITCDPEVGMRLICGQLRDVRTLAPLRVATPTGATCIAGNLEGPCGLQVTAGRKSDYLADLVGAPLPLPTVVDDCGRFRVAAPIDGTEEVAAAPSPIQVAIAAVRVTGPHNGGTALSTSLINRRPEEGVDTGIDVLVGSNLDVSAWIAQDPRFNELTPVDSPAVVARFLVPDADEFPQVPHVPGPPVGVLSTEFELFYNGSAITQPPLALPIAGYFAAPTANDPYAALLSGFNATTAAGAALLVVTSDQAQIFSIGGRGATVANTCRGVANNLSPRPGLLFVNLYDC